MPRAVLAVTALLIGGCGGGDEAATACEDAPQLRPADVVDTSSGHELVAGTPRLAGLADRFRGMMGDRARQVGSRVLVRRGRDAGAAVIVLNSAGESVGGDLLEGARDGAEETGAKVEPLELGGRRGAFVRYADGSFGAAVPVSDCAAVVLVADREPVLRDALEVVVTR